jgi:hypothetical protein
VVDELEQRLCGGGRFAVTSPEGRCREKGHAPYEMGGHGVGERHRVVEMDKGRVGIVDAEHFTDGIRRPGPEGRATQSRRLEPARFGTGKRGA